MSLKPLNQNNIGINQQQFQENNETNDNSTDDGPLSLLSISSPCLVPKPFTDLPKTSNP